MTSRGRTAEWQAYYRLHPQVLASWAEQNGRRPPHEPACWTAFLAGRERDHRDEPCWCDEFCGSCGHHGDEHDYLAGDDATRVPCTQCPDGVCAA